MPNLIVDLQNASRYSHIPTQENLEKWLTNALSFIEINESTVELTIRLVDTQEIQSLNKNYRDKDKPTNVLSFPATYQSLGADVYFLGDLIICLAVVETEAIEQNKSFDNHLAHMTTHGLLHLLGYDHITEEEANEMEALEIEILEKLSISNPYEI